MIRAVFATTLGLNLLLGGCVVGSRVVESHASPIYSLSEFSYAAGGRDLRTVVQGNPFGGPFGCDDPAFGRTVTAIMQGKHAGPPTRFTTTPGESARPLYRVMMVFNPAETIPSADLCAHETLRTKPARTKPATAEPIELQAAFCRGSSTATAVTGYLPGATSPEDPLFRTLVADATMALLSPVRDINRGDDCFGPGC